MVSIVTVLVLDLPDHQSVGGSAMCPGPADPPWLSTRGSGSMPGAGCVCPKFVIAAALILLILCRRRFRRCYRSRSHLCHPAEAAHENEPRLAA